MDVVQATRDYLDHLLSPSRVAGMKLLVLDSFTVGMVNAVEGRRVLLEREIFLIDRIDQLAQRTEQMPRTPQSPPCRCMHAPSRSSTDAHPLVFGTTTAVHDDRPPIPIRPQCRGMGAPDGGKHGASVRRAPHTEVRRVPHQLHQCRCVASGDRLWQFACPAPLINLKHVYAHTGHGTRASRRVRARAIGRRTLR
eukprot:SAG11_NODE_4435_length_1895_cov_4.584633_2_plen_195_part_00